MVEEETERADESAAGFCDEKPTFSKPPLLHLKDEAEYETREKAKNKDVALAQVGMEKKLALIKAWEDNEKSKADNKAHKKLRGIDAWENSKRASLEVQLKQIEENFEKKKAKYVEKMKNKVSEVHKSGKEKRAKIEAGRGKDFLIVEESAAKFRAMGNLPIKLFACFN